MRGSESDLPLGAFCDVVIDTTSEVSMQLGLREANQHFSKAIKAVKAGKEVVLTERVKPIAVIKPLPELASDDAGLRRLIAAGIVRPASKPWPMPRRRARRIKGPPLSQTIREERDAD